MLYLSKSKCTPRRMIFSGAGGGGGGGGGRGGGGGGGGASLTARHPIIPPATAPTAAPTGTPISQDLECPWPSAIAAAAMPPPARAPSPAPIRQPSWRAGDIDEQPAARPATATQSRYVPSFFTTLGFPLAPYQSTGVMTSANLYADCPIRTEPGLRHQALLITVLDNYVGLYVCQPKFVF